MASMKKNPALKALQEPVTVSEASGVEKLAESDFLTIGTLAQMAGITVRTLRYYEEMDLIGPVKRTESQYRLYNHHSLKRLKAILALQDLNHSLEEIVATLGPYSKRQDYNRQEQWEETRRSLQAQLTCIEEKENKLSAMKSEIQERLQTLEATCHPCMDNTPDKACPDSCAYLHVHD
ncbi:MAG: MerR family transcriptional regulator [Vampirovibrionales bacterium]|nr:MerR family transcriptional regulator [Vampirovibrionales bacterium]